MGATTTVFVQLRQIGFERLVAVRPSFHFVSGIRLGGGYAHSGDLKSTNLKLYVWGSYKNW